MLNYFQIVFDKKIYKVFPISIYTAGPWQPCFSRDQINLNIFGRGLPRDHLCQILIKLGQ